MVQMAARFLWNKAVQAFGLLYFTIPPMPKASVKEGLQ